MAIYNGTTSDPVLNGYLAGIRFGRYGKDVRSDIAMSAERCYQLAITRVGGTKYGVTSAHIAEHTSRIRTAVFGEEVRDAIKTVLTLCYTARGKSVPSAENTIFTNMINAQTGEDLKNGILMAIVKCCQDVI